MHRRSQSGTFAHHHHASSRPHSPAPTNGSSSSLETLVPAATSSGTITVTATIVPDWQRKPREYINVAQRKQMRKYGAVRDSGYWNKLLIAARKQRGPYYCPSTRMYHVDKMSKLYWIGYNGKEDDDEKKKEPTEGENKSGAEGATTAAASSKDTAAHESEATIAASMATSTSTTAQNTSGTPVKAESTTPQIPQQIVNPLGSPPHVSASSDLPHPGMMSPRGSTPVQANNNNTAKSNGANPMLAQNTVSQQQQQQQPQFGQAVPSPAGMNPATMMNGMQPNMLANGGFISPSSLMQATPMMPNDPNSMAMQQAYYNMSQINPQMLQKQQQQQQQLLLQQQQQAKNRTR